MRPSTLDGFYFDNILLTEHVLRLIDVGISAMRQQVGDSLFERYVEVERSEMKFFEDYLLNR